MGASLINLEQNEREAAIMNSTTDEMKVQSTAEEEGCHRYKVVAAVAKEQKYHSCRVGTVIDTSLHAPSPGLLRHIVLHIPNPRGVIQVGILREVCYSSLDSICLYMSGVAGSSYIY